MNRAQNEQEFLDAVAMGFCPNCGKAVVQPRRGHPKKFCSEQCRTNWSHRHPRPENWASTRTAVCPMCGRSFLASREYGRLRKYCSRACANRGRAAERRTSGEQMEEPVAQAGKP